FDGQRTIGQPPPWQLGTRVDVDVGRKRTRIVQSADADEADLVDRTAIVAPQRHPAGRTAPDLLPFSTFAWSEYRLRLALRRHDPTAFVQSVDDKCAAGFRLTAGAVAAMHEHRVTLDAVANLAACAAAFVRVAGHARPHSASRRTISSLGTTNEKAPGANRPSGQRNRLAQER